MRIVNLLAATTVIILSNSANAFWSGSGNDWAPFGAGTGYNNQAPWGNNSNWNPFGTTSNWSPSNDAANLSRYGARPQVLRQYRKDSRFNPNQFVPVFQNRVKPSNWLTETDFTSTLRDIGNQNNMFNVDDFAAIGLPIGYTRTKAEALGLGRVLQDYARQREDNPLGTTDTIYGQQGYALSPAASSTFRIKD